VISSTLEASTVAWIRVVERKVAASLRAVDPLAISSTAVLRNRLGRRSVRSLKRDCYCLARSLRLRRDIVSTSTERTKLDR